MARGARNGILSLSIKDKAVLYAAYMPFVKNGGLFIPTKKDYALGDEVCGGRAVEPLPTEHLHRPVEKLGSVVLLRSTHRVSVRLDRG